MKLYLLRQYENNDYDTFDSCIVCAENKEDAVTIDPNGKVFEECEEEEYGCWACKKESIICEEIGKANDKQTRGVVLASFNAG